MSMSETNTKNIRVKLDNLHHEAGLVTERGKLDLGAAKALNWALGIIYSPGRKQPSLEQKILACVSRGLEVAHVNDFQAAKMPSDTCLEWFGGAGWYVDLVEGSDITYPIGPFDSAADAWSEAFIAYGLEGLR